MKSTSRARWATGAVLLLICGATALQPRSAHAAGCEDFVPAGCIRVKTGDRLDPVVKDKCYVLDENSTGANSYDEINVLAGGKILFVDPGFDAGAQKPRTIHFKVGAMLVEKGGVVQAGSPACPFGKEKGRLAFGVYGDDPTKQGTVKPGPGQRGIRCLTNPGAKFDNYRCFPSDDYINRAHYCTERDTDDPCSSTTEPASEPKNHLLESYGKLNYDDNSWGYKTVGVAYGGTLALYGYKGARGLHDADGSWEAENDPPGHCKVPKVATLDQQEMKAWAKLTGTSWARLAGSNDTATTTILTLDRTVGDWEVGDEIVIGATDWYANHSEQRTIRKVTALASATQIEVDVLKYPHFAAIFDAGPQSDFTNPVNRTAVDTRAVVGLLSRSIQFYSLGKTAGEEFPKTLDCTADKTENPECYFGGHLIVRQGFKRVSIQGVEFKWMGQGGRQGHYPVHFHLAKSTAYTNGTDIKGTFVKDSSVWDSMTRFVVIHGTHDVTLARNVGYLSLGHGYFVEDASEIRNRLCHNLGVGARAALHEYVAEQQKPEHWCGGAPPPAARVVPPILDGSILKVGDPGPLSPTGSDSYMPTMYWVMNAYNELVGNAAVSVHGFGSCFWLLGSAVSGASLNKSFDGFAGYNTIDYQAPLLRFRGNSCMTSPLALPSTREINPSTFPEAKNTGFTALENPYLVNGAKYDANYWPVINGSFRPVLEGDKQIKCVSGSANPADLDNNVKGCVTTILDRFSTSFNWAEVNFAAIWLRPWFYLFANGAVTDQLSGGLGFVTGGDWQQAPPAYLALALNNLFVGTTQPQDAKNLYARRSGPRFVVKATENLARYSQCPQGPSTCPFPEAGTGFWHGAFNQKRLLTIYDGPTYADGNAFMNVGAWECDAQPCSGASGPSGCKGFANGEAVLPCGIYGSLTNPVGPSGGTNVAVIDAGIGWKQPNGFYYPPAFDYRRSSFPKNRNDALNMSLTRAPGDFENLRFQPGALRHNVLDRTQEYQIGNMVALDARTLAKQSGPQNTLDASTIDFATILLDLDGSLTGSTSTIDGRPSPGLTTSVSRNTFYDAPSQSPECLSYGLQTSPYTFLSTVMGELRDPPGTEKNAILRGGGGWGKTPAVAIYRQWKLKEDEDREKATPCGQVCDGQQYGCKRASFMGMAELSQPSYLTMTQPQGLSSAQTGALYYLDTNSGAQDLGCERANPGFSPAKFEGGRSYVLYNLFPQRDSKTSYQLHVGDAVKDIAEIEFRYVRVTVQERDTTNAALQKVEQPCDPRQQGQWCSGLPQPNPVNGVLTVTIDHQKLLKDEAFTAAARHTYDRCMPRDLCYFDAGANRCRRCDPGAPDGDAKKCLRAGDFLTADLDSMNALDKSRRRPLDDVCEQWSSMVSGQIKIDDGASITSADCPAGGCVGVAFKLPQGFSPKPYATVNAGQGGLPLSRCFVESTWMKDVLVKTSNDPQCGAPRPQASSDFCSDPKLDLPVDADATISESNPGLNQGESSELVVGGGQPSNAAATAGETGDAGGLMATADEADDGRERSLVAFDAGAIDSFLASQPLVRATLEVTTRSAIEDHGVLVDAHPLLRSFTEGDPADHDPEDDLHVGGVIPIGGRRLPLVHARPTPAPPDGQPPLIADVPGVTWSCFTDLDTGNGQVTDCVGRWTNPGGDYLAATAEPALAAGPEGTVLAWDVTEDVLNGTSSWLLRLRDEDSSGHEHVFYSEEGALRIGEPELGPVLVLE